MTLRNKRIFIHIIISAVVLFIPVALSPDWGHFDRMLHSRGFFRESTGFVLSLLFFYLNYILLIPYLWEKKHYRLFILLVLTSMICIVYVPMLIPAPGPIPLHAVEPEAGIDQLASAPIDSAPRQMVGPGPKMEGGPNPVNMNVRWMLGGLLQCTIAFLISWLLWMDRRLKQTEKARVETDLAFLRSQVNPHFLFNSLNTIYALSIAKSDQTPAAVAGLSAMMRYVTTESSKERMPLAEEIAYIRNYISLQQLRFGNTVKVNFSQIGMLNAHSIAPLILITFIENAFKYGVNPEEESVVSIKIDISAAGLTLETSNRKVKVRFDKNAGTGIGLAITRQRLALLYPNRHVLEIRDEPECYHVVLHIYW